MGRRYETVSFLSDFGTADECVGVVKAVIRDLAPHARVIDLTHEIPPFDVRAGSLALARGIAYVPSGVVLAVVDPGVGTDRRAVAIEVADGDGVLVGPDNGLLAPAVAMAGGAERAVVLTNTELHLAAPGVTFAGRDVFAPVAAHLCNGVDLAELGEPIEADLLLPGVVPLPARRGRPSSCEVLWVDRFGNCQLNVGPDDLPGGVRRRIELRFGAPTDPTGGCAAVRAGSVRRPRRRRRRPRPRRVRHARRVDRPALGGRRARPRRRRPGDAAASDDAGVTQPVTLRRRPETARFVRIASPMRPATTLTLGLLLLAILVAGIISLLRL